MSAHIVAEEQTRHRAVVVQKQWQKKPHWMGIYQPTSYKYAVSCFSPRVCAMEALWRSIPVSRWCVLCHKAEHSQGQWILLSTVLNVAWQQKEAAWMGKHHLHRFIHFDLNRWCHADQQTGENVKDVCVCVCVCVCTCRVSMRSIIHCFKHVLRTYFTSFEGELCSICFYFEGFICTSVL